MKTDVLIAGSGCAGLYLAINLPRDKNVLIITKSKVYDCDSYLAQGGICMLRDETDFESFYNDTLKAGHFENCKESVEVMIKSSPDVLKDLLEYGTEFNRDEKGELMYTKEGAHSKNRILFHKDITGREITEKLFKKVKTLKNVTVMEDTALVDIISRDNICYGGIVADKENNISTVEASYTVFATGGVGGLFKHSTNFKHLTGDALAIALKHNVELKDVSYVQIHPTTLYSEKAEERSFLISESVRGEGAKLYNKNMERFANELLPRDLLTKEILKQMDTDKSEFVWEDLRTIPKEEVAKHFPNIVAKCKERGYDVYNECIPVVPAQHYFMGGVKIDTFGKTSMKNLYAVGETACNGVHGRNRLASNSLLESLVFAKRAAEDIAENKAPAKEFNTENIDLNKYNNLENLKNEYKKAVLSEINK